MMDLVYQHHFKSLENLIRRTSSTTRLRISELCIALIYPCTVLLGQLLHHITPESENYYTNKYNVLNVVFVKQGWAWTLGIVLYFMIQHYGFNQRMVIRVIMGTLWWFIFTQWFFGLPIMDRVFLSTGGVCDLEVDIESGMIVGSMLCRKMKGSWIGGHDPSGHVFLLVHSSLILWFELLERGVLIHDLKKLREDYRALKSQRRGFLDLELKILKSSTVLLLLLLALWWWMLLITSTHFHYFSEKITGLIAGYVGIFIYIIPRFI